MASTLSTEALSSDFIPDQKDVDRSNLLLLSRLVLRGLLEYCMQSKNRLFTSEQKQLLDLFIMVEKVLRHGFKSAKSLITLRTPEQDLWLMIERLGKLSKDVEETVSCVQQLPNVHSPICRVRAWLRLAAMQKKLADYFHLIVEAKPLLREYYEEWALLSHETTGVVFAGSLIGMRVLDCNLFLKEDDLTQQPLSVDLSSYIKIPTVPLGEEGISESGISEAAAKEMKSILDQKNYLEERNRQLVANITNLERRLAILENMRRHRSKPLDTDGKENGVAVSNANEENLSKSDSHDNMLPITKVDELETAMSLLEKDVHEKQDTIVSLREQIDDVKKINLDLYQKLRAFEQSGKQKDKLIVKLEAETEKDQTVWQNKVKKLQARVDELEIKVQKSESFSNNLQFELKKKTEFCSELQKELADSQTSNRMLDESRSAERLAREDLQTKVLTLQNAEKQYLELQKYYEEAQSKVIEYERTLEEMGVHLSQSKLKVEDLKEGMMPLAEAQWESDKEVAFCKLCQEKFSVSRRKHHCRNCGGIFCNSCSENTMPLPSSARPVRVCDGCYEILLKRYSSKAPTDTS